MNISRIAVYGGSLDYQMLSRARARQTQIDLEDTVVAVEMMRMCCRVGVRVRIEDTVGCELSNAAVAHLAVTVPPVSLMAAYQCSSYGLSLGVGNPTVSDGHLTVSDATGLGVTVDESTLGKPLLEWRV